MSTALQVMASSADQMCCYMRRGHFEEILYEQFEASTTADMVSVLQWLMPLAIRWLLPARFVDWGMPWGGSGIGQHMAVSCCRAMLHGHLTRIIPAAPTLTILNDPGAGCGFLRVHCHLYIC